MRNEKELLHGERHKLGETQYRKSESEQALELLYWDSFITESEYRYPLADIYSDIYSAQQHIQKPTFYVPFLM